MCPSRETVPYAYHLYVVSSRGGYKWKSYGAESGFNNGCALRVIRGTNGWISFCSKEELRRDASQYLSEGAATFVCKFMVKTVGEKEKARRAMEEDVYEDRTLGDLLWEKDEYSDVTIMCVDDKPQQEQEQQQDGEDDDIQEVPFWQPPRRKRARPAEKEPKGDGMEAGPSKKSGDDPSEKEKEKNKGQKGDFVMEVFHCHRLVLKARSDVFKAMFSHGPGAVAEERDGKIRITDLSPRTVRDMLEFMYKDT